MKAMLSTRKPQSFSSPLRTLLGRAGRSNASSRPLSQAPKAFSRVRTITPRSTATFRSTTRMAFTSLAPCPRQGVCLMASPATLLSSAPSNLPRAVFLARSNPSQSRTQPLLRQRSPCRQLLFHRSLVRRRLLPQSTSSISSALMRKICRPSLVARGAARAKRAVTVSDLADAVRMPVLASKAVSAKMRATVAKDAMVVTWAYRSRRTLISTLMILSQLLPLAVLVSSLHLLFLTRTRRGSVELITHGHSTNLVCFFLFFLIA
jgi:hypothetical protein